MPLELLHALTGSDRMELHVAMREGSETAFAKYGAFGVGSRDEKFVLSVDEYAEKSTAGESLLYQNGGKWSTIDEDNDTWGGECTVKCNGPGWHKACQRSNPLGGYGSTEFCRGINWRTFKHKTISLDYIEYLVRPNPCLSGASKYCSHC